MPWPVYSERLLHHKGAGTWTFTVPDDTRLVLTNLEAISEITIPAQVWLAVGGILLEYLTLPAQWSTVHRVMRVVAYQGEDCTMGINSTGTHCTLSGYLFKDDSGRTGPPITVVERELTRPEALPTAV